MKMLGQGHKRGYAKVIKQCRSSILKGGQGYKRWQPQVIIDVGQGHKPGYTNVIKEGSPGSQKRLSQGHKRGQAKVMKIVNK